MDQATYQPLIKNHRSKLWPLILFSIKGQSFEWNGIKGQSFEWNGIKGQSFEWNGIKG